MLVFVFVFVSFVIVSFVFVVFVFVVFVFVVVLVFVFVLFVFALKVKSATDELLARTLRSCACSNANDANLLLKVDERRPR